MGLRIQERVIPNGSDSGETPPPAEKKVTQHGENLTIDLHPLFLQLFLRSLSAR
jgi:hypothetical protein